MVSLAAGKEKIESGFFFRFCRRQRITLYRESWPTCYDFEAGSNSTVLAPSILLSGYTLESLSDSHAPHAKEPRTQPREKRKEKGYFGTRLGSRPESTAPTPICGVTGVRCQYSRLALTEVSVAGVTCRKPPSENKEVKKKEKAICSYSRGRSRGTLPNKAKKRKGGVSASAERSAGW